MRYFDFVFSALLANVGGNSQTHFLLLALFPQTSRNSTSKHFSNPSAQQVLINDPQALRHSLERMGVEVSAHQDV